VELETVGWGRNEESWSIDHHVIEGDPETPQVWEKVDAYLKRVWYRYDGMPFEVMAACIDSGGHNTQKVYEFAKARLNRRIWAIKGASERSGARSPVWPTKRPSNRNKSSFKPVIIGTNSAKDVIRARLTYEEPGPGYMHFPSDRDVGYFAQLTAEVSMLKVSGGHQYRVWVLPNGKANEALDCRVYSYAALCGLAHFGLKLNRLVDEVSPVLAGAPPSRVESTAAIALAGPSIKTEGEAPRSRTSKLA
jgi:phage terminase large subunit GpA-like protein